VVDEENHSCGDRAVQRNRECQMMRKGCENNERDSYSNIHVRHVSHLLPPHTTDLMGRYKERLAIMQMWGWMLADCSSSESK
jgi:hypothetical protein